MGKRKHSVNLVFTIALLGAFALTALFAVTLGVQVYARSANDLQSNFDTRTSLIYISEKFRQCPGERFEIGQVGDSDALILTEEHDGQDYDTWIYAHEGKMYELLIKSGDSVSPGDGQRIMDLSSLQAEETNGLLTVTVVNSEGKEESISLSARTRG